MNDLPLQAGQAVEILVLVKAEVSSQSAQEIASSRPKKGKAGIRRLLAATRGSIPGKKNKDEIDREVRLMREEWVREWE
ncbi:MAG: hypothetical protein GY862_00300 [Gammaproteobacteria bacterium]|nr:hypothetical protein [Gammaproteobacteria bacterium]